jgi:glycosyltransferase involved in cell wall biosynthesis
MTADRSPGQLSLKGSYPERQPVCRCRSPIEMPMRVLIATVKVPFVHGGAEIHAAGLLRALHEAGHDAEIVALPFKSYPPERILDQMLSWRLLDLTEHSGWYVDRVIGLKFPAYLVPHSHKILWILHQHRPAYDLWDHAAGDLIQYPDGAQIREAIQRADQTFIPEAQAVFTNSRNISHRLWQYCHIDSLPLYHPPQHDKLFYTEAAEDYFFFPSRLQPLKRQALVLKALSQTVRSFRVFFAGSADEPSYVKELEDLSLQLNIARRVEWLGYTTEGEKRALYARALGVIFPPMDEDYGYVTLEAMLASKPVITCTDSGGPLEFVRSETTGLAVEPSPEALAMAMDRLGEDRDLAKAMGEAGRMRYDSLDISWSKVVERLLS